MFWPLRNRETVAGDTPARLATSVMVAAGVPRPPLTGIVFSLDRDGVRGQAQGVRVPAGASLPGRCAQAGQAPTGCHAVLISTNASISSRPWLLPAPARRTRLPDSAARRGA